MREHMGLYRGKRTVNGAWIEGYLYITNEGIHEISVYETATNIERYTYIVDPETVGECAGLPDKNGKLIFEGDIVKIVGDLIGILSDEPQKTVVKWQIEDCGFNLPSCFDYEIIGNIHDNPELLKGEG